MLPLDRAVYAGKFLYLKRCHLIGDGRFSDEADINRNIAESSEESSDKLFPTNIRIYDSFPMNRNETSAKARL